MGGVGERMKKKKKMVKWEFLFLKIALLEVVG